MDSSQAHSPTDATPDTYYAPAGRDTPEKLARERLLVENAALLRATLDAMPTIVVVLNGCRQIVGTNDLPADRGHQCGAAPRSEGGA